MPMFATNNATNAMTTMLPTAAAEWSYVATGAEQHKPILAQRFRTKLCNKFAECGSCPYLHRCMFAHGEAELRTAGQNVADGLVSEEAIRAFKRYHFEADKLRSYATAPHHHQDDYTRSFQGYFTGYASTSYGYDCHATESSADDDDMSLRSHGTHTPPPSLLLSATVGTASSSPSSSQRARRHDPYAETSAWHPLSLQSSTTMSARASCGSPLAAYAKAL